MVFRDIVCKREISLTENGYYALIYKKISLLNKYLYSWVEKCFRNENFKAGYIIAHVLHVIFF